MSKTRQREKGVETAPPPEPTFNAAPYNPRQITAEAMKGLRASLRTFGDLSGFVVNRQTGNIVCGHQRREALDRVDLGQVRWIKEREVELGSPGKRFRSVERSGMIEVGGLTFGVRMVDWPLEFEKAANVAANATTIQGEFTEQLDALLAEIRETSPEVFSELNYIELFIGDSTLQEGQTDPDDIPEAPDKAVTQSGDCWVLGDHRLLCGDSSNPEDVDRLLDGQPIHLVNTDPPYNVKVEPRSNNAIAAGLSSFPASDAIESADARGMHHQGFDLARHKGKAHATHKKLRPKDRPLANDFVSDEEFERLLDAWFGNMARVLEPGRAFYIWGGYANCVNYPPVLKRCELYFSQAIIWVKEHPVLTRKDFMGNHEWCFYGWREGAAHVFLGPNNAVDVWPIKKVNPQSMVHLTEKPVELAARAMQYSSRPGDNVLDLFGGSGSTLIGAEQTGRRAFLMELDPLYCDVIVQRWEKFTGRKGERISPTAEIPARRRGRGR